MTRPIASLALAASLVLLSAATAAAQTTGTINAIAVSPAVTANQADVGSLLGLTREEIEARHPLLALGELDRLMFRIADRLSMRAVEDAGTDQRPNDVR